MHQGLEDSYGVVSVQPFRLVARLASFAPPPTTQPATSDVPTAGSSAGSGSVQRRLSSWFARPLQLSAESVLRRGSSIGRSLASQPSVGAQRLSVGPPAPRVPRGLVGVGLPEDSVAEHDEEELAHGMSGSQEHEVQLLSVAQGIDLSEAQREQAARLAQLYVDADRGLEESFS